MMLIPNTRREHNTLSHQNMPVEAVVMGAVSIVEFRLRWSILISFWPNSRTRPTRPRQNGRHFRQMDFERATIREFEAVLMPVVPNVATSIQFLRGLLACWLAFSIWVIWGHQLALEVSSERYTAHLRRQFTWTLAATAAILVFGSLFTEFLGGMYEQNVQEEARGDIDLLASRRRPRRPDREPIWHPLRPAGSRRRIRATRKASRPALSPCRLRWRSLR